MMFYFVRVMGRLSEYERSQIHAMHNAGNGIRCSGNFSIGGCNLKFFKNPGSYGTKKGSRRPPKLSAREKRKIIMNVSNSTKSANQIKGECSLNALSYTMLRVIHESPHLQRAKLKAALNVRKDDKLHCLSCACENMDCKWNEVKFYCKCTFM
jgi:hypothetical protein